MLTPEVFGLLVFTTLKETWKVLTPEVFGPLVLPGIYDAEGDLEGADARSL